MFEKIPLGGFPIDAFVNPGDNVASANKTVVAAKEIPHIVYLNVLQGGVLVDDVEGLRDLGDPRGEGAGFNVVDVAVVRGFMGSGGYFVEDCLISLGVLTQVGVSFFVGPRVSACVLVLKIGGLRHVLVSPVEKCGVSKSPSSFFRK